MLDVLEILSEPRFSADSSIVFTYELHLPLYEGWIRRRLMAAGANLQFVFCDSRTYESELQTQTIIRHLGRSYAVTPVRCPGAFHPKIYLLLGQERGRLVVGSGNATIGGLVRNAELFGVFDYNRASQAGPHPAFRTVISLAQREASFMPQAVRRKLEHSLSLAPWMTADPVPDGRTLMVGGPADEPLWSQVQAQVGQREIVGATVLSSSFDRDLAFLKALADRVTGPVRCIVQHDRVLLDGARAVRLPESVEWYEFLDPYPPEARKRKDAFAHAKLLVLDTGEEEYVVYGSANASRPAYLAGENAEAVVGYWRSSGSTVRELNLASSLDAAPITSQVHASVWSSDSAERDGYDYTLVGVAEGFGGFEVTFGGAAPEQATLELAESLHRPALASAPLQPREFGGLWAALAEVPAAVRVARVVGPEGRRLTNTVGVTWREFEQRHHAGRFPSNFQAGLAAIQDGVVLSTVLFDLLNLRDDFDVILARPGTQKAEKPDDAVEASEPRGEESFRTGRVPDESSVNLSGDRLDLDLLAALVQPINVGRSSRTATVDPLELADLDTSEEEERREIDENGGSATGEERRQRDDLPERVKFERAVRRLEQRLKLVSARAEALLEEMESLTEIPPRMLARQACMIHIAAFLCGRKQRLRDNSEIVCLHPRAFASFVLRMCRVLSGPRGRGVLQGIRHEHWNSPDGETLRNGLAFLWTCAIWATAYLRTEQMEDGAEIWEAVPELIAGHFVAGLKAIVSAFDEVDLPRRLPGTLLLPAETIELARKRLDELAELFADESMVVATAESESAALPTGALVFHKALGHTIVTRTEPGRVCLLDLSRPWKASIRKYVHGAQLMGSSSWDLAAAAERLACSQQPDQRNLHK